MPAVYEHRCRRCDAVRTPPIEGPCNSCGGYYRTVKRRVRGGSDGEDDTPLPDGPVSVGALLDRQDDRARSKRPTGLPGLDHVFGGGLPEAGTVLFCAKEGTGKTSLLVELLLHLRIRSLLLSTEQSKEELIEQFARFGEERILRASKHMSVESATQMDDILDIIEDHKPKVLALDSLHDIEGVYDDNGNPMSSSGDRAVTRVAKVLHRLARTQGFFAFLVGHMANDGTMMGGAHLRHAVGGTLILYRLSDNEKDPRRVLRFRGKTRYGPLGREALFRMTDDGFKDCGPILDKEKDEDEDETPAPAERPPRPRSVPVRPGKSGQVLPFPRRRPGPDDNDEPPEPAPAA